MDVASGEHRLDIRQVLRGRRYSTHVERYSLQVGEEVVITIHEQADIRSVFRPDCKPAKYVSH